VVIVLDASVATKLFVAEPQSDAAEGVIARYPLMLAPTLICVEVASALTRKVRNHEIDRDTAEAALLSWQEFLELGNLRLTPDRSLLPEAAALSLTLAHPLGDCLYLALARRHSFPLVTADRPFGDAVRGGAAEVHLLGEFAAGAMWRPK
jgi:predicted nucleic acid-binding protein